MKKLIILLILLFSVAMNAQVEKAKGIILDTLTTVELDALPAIAKVKPALYFDRTKDNFVYWNGSNWVDIGSAGASTDWASITGKPTNLDEDSTDDVTLTGNQTIQKQLTMGGGSLIIKNSTGGTNSVTVTMPNEDQLSLNPSAGNALGFNFLTGQWTVGVDNIIDESDLIDDDTFATATATNIPSAESVKAYVDAGGSFGVVASGSVPVGENTAGTIFTAIHNLGYAPSANRISMNMIDLASNSPVGLEPKITDVTTTTFDFTLGSTTGAGIGLNVSWFILGNGNVSPVIEGHNIEDGGSGVTKRANLNFTGAVTVTDDAGNDRTTIDITGGSAQTLSISGSESDQLSISGGNTVDLSEGIQDNVGNMVGGNTENGIDVTYDDVAGKLNFDVTDQNAVDVPVVDVAGNFTGDNVEDVLTELDTNIKAIDQTQSLTLSGTGNKDLTISSGNTIDLTGVDGIDPLNTTMHPDSPIQGIRFWAGTQAQRAAATTIVATDVVYVTDEQTEYVYTIPITSNGGDIATATNLMPFHETRDITITGVAGSVNVAGTSSVITYDINVNGTSILSTKLTIDAGEKTSNTAATAAVISDTTVAAWEEFSFDIDTADSGDTGAHGTIYITYTID